MSETKPNPLLKSLQLPILLVVFLWIVHLLQYFTSTDFGPMGIYPRHFFGLRGVFLAPLIHADFAHLISNSIPLLALSGIIFYFYRRVAVRSFLMIYLLTGLAVWAFGRSVFHIGASGVVYGLVAFIAWNGIFRRNIKAIVLALIVIFFYQGMFAGVLPDQEGISWESHLYGAMVGIFTSFFYKEELEEDEEEKPDPFAHEAFEVPEYFLRRDAFAMTREERRAFEQQQRLDQENDSTGFDHIN